MPRPLRIQYAGAWYHVMDRGRRGEEVPESRFPVPGADKIIEEVCKFYQVHKKDLFASRRWFF